MGYVMAGGSRWSYCGVLWRGSNITTSCSRRRGIDTPSSTLLLLMSHILLMILLLLWELPMMDVHVGRDVVDVDIRLLSVSGVHLGRSSLRRRS